MALSVIAPIPRAAAEPGDVFTIAAPAVTDPPPKASDINVGDASVSTQTGALTYGYHLKVPPGRNGTQPSVSLAYSSQAPIYGTVAAGWSIAGIPMIEMDTSEGRIAPNSVTFVSSLSGGRPLIPVTEPGTGIAQFRAQNDSSWTRYEQVDHNSNPFFWRALTPDGSMYLFGHTDAHTAGCGNVSLNYAPLTQMIDKFGNQIDYIWEPSPTPGECRIAAITWGQNGVAKLGYFAAIKFNYSTSQLCSENPVGSQVSYRSGVKIVTGASQIDTIQIAAFPPQSSSPITTQPIPSSPDHTRTITLSYSGTTGGCIDRHAMYRSLDSIQETAVGVDQPQVVLPPISFAYGAAGLDWSSASSQSPHWTYAHSPTDVYNLGWGYRFESGGGWPTVEATMIDIDGDGRLDRLTNDPYNNTANNRGFCRARWERNLGPSPQGEVLFAAPAYIHMPTLKWASPNSYAGGLFPRQTPNTEELCSLNYQRTAFVNSAKTFSGGTYGRCVTPSGMVDCPTQAGQSGYCDASIGGNKSDCSTKNGSSNNTFFAWRWFDIDGDSLPDLVGSPIQGGIYSYDLQQGTGLTGNPGGAPVEPAIFGAFPSCPSQAYVADPTDTPSRPYTMCKGMFPWFIYKNHGNGQFGQPRPGEGPTDNSTWGPLPDSIVYQPIQLESTTGDSSLTSSPVGQFQGVVDIDGDGFTDAVTTAANSTWSVFHNDRHGKMVPYFQTFPFFFNVGTDYRLQQGDGITAQGFPAAGQGLFDFTGDGLPDHWVGCPDPSCLGLIAFNDGLQFRLPGGQPESNAMKPGVISQGFNYQQSGSFTQQGLRIDSRSVFDADFDGRPDIADFPSGVLAPRIYFNEGGQFVTDNLTRGDLANVNHMVGAEDVLGFYLPNNTLHTYSWETRSSEMDLDGDGIPEGYYFGDSFIAPGTMSILKVPMTTRPPRLLYQIDAHRGAVTTVDYASIHSSTVQDDPANGSRMPTNQYVVKQIKVDDSLAGTSSSSTYFYKGPQFLPDDRGHYGFRGFADVTTTSPSLAQTIEHFGYSPDWSGRLEKSVVMPKTSEQSVANEVRTVDITTWEARQLFTNAATPLTTYHPITHQHMVCANGQTEAMCTATAAAGYTLTTNTLTPIATSVSGGNGAQLMYVETSSLSQAGIAAANGDRRTDTVFYLDADSSTYRLVTLSTTDLERNGSSFIQYAKSAQNWTNGFYADSSYRVPYETIVWLDAQNTATTFREFDLNTGNITKIWKPVQWTTNPNPFINMSRTALTYDARQLFEVTEVNELSHQRNFVWEYGTGTKLETLGPKANEDHRIRIDGLGRVIERYETFYNNDFSIYFTELVETNAYVDGPQASVAHSTEFLHSQYRQERTDLDGHGRPLVHTVFTLGSAPADEVTHYAYANDGTLTSVVLPDPSANNASTVTYTYAFDSLGRPTSMRRPDAALVSSQSGIDIVYNGLTATTTEAVGAAGGQRASTQTKHDAFGRLIEVQEQRLASPITWAVTSYAYGPDDNMKQITDAQGAVTLLTHDQAGRRTAITRANKTWRYGYDINGNMISEQTPCTPVGSCEANYTSTTAYDDLDRPVSKVNAPRNLTASDQALFASATETFDYDFTAIGQLGAWSSFAPGASTYTTGASFHYSLQNQIEDTTARTSATGMPEIGQRFTRYYAFDGQPQKVYYRDSMGSACPTGGYSQTSFDARGLPSYVTFQNCYQHETGNLALSVVNNRNVAGLVTKQFSRFELGQGPFTNAESNWTYDTLGRVTSQVVNSGSPLAQVARQDLHYLGNDNPDTLDHWLGASNHKHFTYTYDLRHQLTNVGESGNAFTATYAYGTAGRFSTAVETAAALPNSNVKARNVSYVYDTTDPEELITLKKSNNKPFASYTYDLAGNELSRDYPDTKEHWDYVYDGKNQLRRATKKVNGAVSGSEEYWYDLNGNRMLVAKRGSSGTKTEMVFFLGDTEAHYDGANTLTRVFSHVMLGTAVFRMDRDANAPSNGEYQFHGLADNTLASVENATGTVNASFDYAPFGEVIEATNAGGAADGLAAHKRRMNDKFIDDIDDLAYYGARYYDRTSMTWTQTDPLFRFAPDAAWIKPRRSSLYMMSVNNPMRYVDPDGRSDTTINGDLVNAARAFAVWLASNPEVLPVVAEAAPFVAGAVVLGTAVLASGQYGSGTDDCFVSMYQVSEYTDDELVASTQENFNIPPNVISAEQPSGLADAAGRQTASQDGGPMALQDPLEAKTYQTYTKKNPQTGEVYTGRTSGTNSPKKNVEKRDKNHHMNKKGFNKAKLDKSSKSKNAIRGREQMGIDKNGGAKSAGGTSGNAINGISPDNDNYNVYMNAAKKL